MSDRRYICANEAEKLLNLPWETLTKELDDMDKRDMKILIAYASGRYQVNRRR